MRGTWMLSWILIICLSQVAVQSQYYSETLPYHPRPVKGIASVAGMNASSTEYLDFGFNTGKFNGSSLSVFSRGEPDLAVVGGRGQFMMATGVAQFNPILVNATNTIAEFNVTVIHY
ncbi:hypothetical protein V6Z12_D05G432800 [Gossypium hirsutum]